MADPTPLLSQSNPADPQPPLAPRRPPSLDETLERYIGDSGRAQLLQAFLVTFAWVFDAQQTFTSVFTDAQPAWHCTDQLGTELCTSISDICQLPKDSWAWSQAVGSSIVSEWNLACAGSFLMSLPASSFFMGSLAGGFVLGTLADSTLGRKNMLLLSCLLMSTTGILTVFSSNIWLYSALRFLSGFGRATIGTCAIVLSTELVGKRWRSLVGVCNFVLFTLGFLSLPAIAYLNRDSSWRYLYLWTSVPALLYCVLVCFFVRESPRWLLVRGYKEEAAATLKSMGSISSSSSLTLSFSSLPFEEGRNADLNVYSVINILLEKRWALRRLATVITLGFGLGMVYYGMPLALGNLPFNLYVNVTLNALSELPASLVAFFFIESLNRKSSVLVLTITSGVCSIMCVVMGKHWATLKMGIELISFFSTCTAADILLIYTIELFPTCIRNSAMGMLRQALVFGGVFCPIIAAMGRGNGYLSYGVFGAMIISCGLFVGCLPETKGGTLCDTMEEEENKQRAGLDPPLA